jgi:O-antigen ligase
MVYARHPFVGFGPRTFREVFPLMQQLADKGTSSWHNDFLQVYMESGLLGLIPLCWLVAAAVYWGARMLRSPVLAPESRRILLPFMCSILIFGLAGGMRDTVVGIVFRFDLAVLALMAANFQGKSVSINDG